MLCVMAGQQHLRHRPALPHLRPRVVRVFEQAALRSSPRPALSASPITPGSSRTQASISAIAAGSPPDSTKSPSETSSSRARLDHALVDALEAAAEQRDARARGELAHARLVERPAARRQVDQRRPGPRRRRAERRVQHVGAHHHAGAAAERRVVDACGACRARSRGCRPCRAATAPAPSAAPGERMRRADPGTSPGRSSARSRARACVMRPAACRHDPPRIRSLRRSSSPRLASGRSITTRPPSTSTTGTHAPGEGQRTRSSPSGRSISSTSPAPKFCTDRDRPSGAPAAYPPPPGRSGRRGRIRPPRRRQAVARRRRAGAP